VKKRTRVLPALTLFLLPPIIGELLSSSAPPAEFFNPLGFVMLVLLYGGGAMLIRELTRRWGKGWPTVLLLGAAYGMAEEGLMVKSFFDPNWEDLGLLGSYGRWFDVNWVWSLELTIFHAVFSIGIPILLVNLMFPAQRTEAWIGRRAFTALLILWIAEGVFIFFFITAYRPPLVPYLMTGLAIAALIVLARYLPSSAAPPEPMRMTHPFWFGLAGFLFAAGLLILPAALSSTEIHPLLTMLLLIGLAAAIAWIVLKVLGNGLVWSERHRLALASGGLGFFIFIAPLSEMDSTRPDNTAGMALVGLAMALFLVWMAWRRRRRERLEDQ